jgi:hypothetical protein
MTDFPFPRLKLALTTPFDAGGRIDFGRLEENLERYLALGIPGFVLSSGTGMHVYLSKEKSKQRFEDHQWTGENHSADLIPSLARCRGAHTPCGRLWRGWRHGPAALLRRADGVFAVCGCDGLSGIAAAEKMLGYNSELTQIYRRFPAPKALPPRPFTTLGAKANLAFRQWKAGAE